jgi:transposase
LDRLYKHGEKQEVREWVKCHLMTGVKTNVVTGVELTLGNEHDSPQFEPLVEKTAEQFNIEEVTADKAYNGRENYQLVADLGGEAYIPFRKGSTGRSKGSPAWKKMYHKFQYQTEEFREHYHKRSNVETAFHMIKQKFGEDVNSKKTVSQKNEVLLKVLCHNICVMIHEMHELGTQPEF